MTSNILSAFVNVFTSYGIRLERGRLKILLYTLNCDESGLGESEKVCIVAGFMGNDPQWCSFINDWLNALKPRKSLHVKELRFTGKKIHRTVRVLSACGPIPYKYNLEPIVGAVRHEDANATFAARGLNDIFAAPFMLAINAVIHTALKLLHPDDELLIVYERQDRYVHAMRFMEEQVFRLRDIDPRVRGIVPVEKGDTCCTEPADYLAYMTRETAANGYTEIFRMGESIFGGKPEVAGHLWTRGELDNLVTEYIEKGIIIPSDFMRRAEMKKDNNEFKRFDATMKKLISVPHYEIKAKLDAEKKAKKKNPKRGGKK